MQIVRLTFGNQRLIDMRDGFACFRYKDDADAGQTTVMTISCEEIMRHFLLHMDVSRPVESPIVGNYAPIR